MSGRMSSFAGDRSFFRKSPVAKHGFKPSTSVHIAHDKKTKLALHKIASNNGRHSYLTTQSVDEFLREEAKQTYGEKMRKRKETQEQLKREREMRIKAQREQSRAKFEASREKRQKEKALITEKLKQSSLDWKKRKEQEKLAVEKEKEILAAQRKERKAFHEARKLMKSQILTKFRASVSLEHPSDNESPQTPFKRTHTESLKSPMELKQAQMERIRKRDQEILAKNRERVAAHRKMKIDKKKIRLQEDQIKRSVEIATRKAEEETRRKEIRYSLKQVRNSIKLIRGMKIQPARGQKPMGQNRAQRKRITPNVSKKKSEHPTSSATPGGHDPIENSPAASVNPSVTETSSNNNSVSVPNHVEESGGTTEAEAAKGAALTEKQNEAEMQVKGEKGVSPNKAVPPKPKDMQQSKNTENGASRNAGNDDEVNRLSRQDLRNWAQAEGRPYAVNGNSSNKNIKAAIQKHRANIAVQNLETNGAENGEDKEEDWNAMLESAF